MEFHTSLARYRKQRGLSQEELAGRLGVSRQAVSKWETGEALPDLQKAVLLAETLGVGVDALCGRDAQAAQPEERPAPPRRRLARGLPAVGAACLLLGFLAGFFWPAPSPPAESPAARLPDTVAVECVSFGLSGGALTYRFVPSVVGEGYTYQITFTGVECEPVSFDAPCVGGVCSGKADLSEYDTYTVNVLIENGEEGRSVPIAWNLSFTPAQGHTSWSS